MNGERGRVSEGEGEGEGEVIVIVKSINYLPLSAWRVCEYVSMPNMKGHLVPHDKIKLFTHLVTFSYPMMTQTL